MNYSQPVCCLYLALIALLFACTDNYSTELARPTCYVENPEAFYEVVDEAIIHIPEENPSKYRISQIQSFPDSSLFAYLGRNTSCIYLYQLETSTFSYKICLDDLRYNQVEDFFVHNLDSIFISLSSVEVGLMNRKGKLLNRWSLIPHDISEDAIPDYSLDPLRKSLYFDGTHLHLTLDPTDLWYREPQDRPKLGMAIEVSSGEKSLYGRQYGIYAQDTELRELPFIHSYPYLRYYKDTVLISFPFSHESSLYHWESDSALKQFCAASNYLPTLAPLLPPDYDVQTRIHFEIENGYYGPLEYHESLGLYSRQVEHNMPLKTEDGLLRSPVSRPRSLLLFNRSLECVGEIHWPANYLFAEWSSVTKDGFWVLISMRGIENEIKLEKVKLRLPQP